MEPRCTCGAILPEDARFCHKCGKPQLAEDIERLRAFDASPAPVSIPPAATPAQHHSVGLNNLQAVVITMATAALALVVLSLVARIAPPLALLVLCGAGYAAARFYRSRTTEPLSAGAGALLGVMTGFWLFVVVVICVAVMSVYISSPAGRDVLRSSMLQMPELAKMLDNPHQFTVNLLLSLIPVFFIATISAAFGGMLAARTSARQRPQ